MPRPNQKTYESRTHPGINKTYYPDFNLGHPLESRSSMEISQIEPERMVCRPAYHKHNGNPGNCLYFLFFKKERSQQRIACQNRISLQ